jgi:hypothetical protein
MPKKIRFGLVAVGLAFAAMTVAASALPPAGDDPPEETPPPTRPPRPPITGTPPPPTTPRVLQSLAVSTDSVVATATIRYNGSPGVVTVVWGDGTVHSRDPNGPINSPRPNPNPDPPGTITFKHAYAPPANGAGFTASITARIGSESQSAAILVSPRYRVTQYQPRLTPLMPCDSSLEQYTEWRVVRSGSAAAGKTWEFDLWEPSAWVGDYPGQTYALPDSIVSFEGRVDQAGSIDYHVTELDPVFDQVGDLETIDLDPLLGSRSVTLHHQGWDTFPTGTCAAEIRADINVTLLKPGLGGGPVAGQ